jgi:WD40 repeat protein
MDPREDALLAIALERPAEKRSAFLDLACEGDPALRQRLESRLAATVPPAGEPTQTPSELAATVVAESILVEDAGVMIGRYKLIEKLGEGGFGTVWLAEQREPVRRKVALKIIKLGMDTKAVVARFEAERQALAMMDHPNIAKVLDAGTTDTGRPYFVMELVRGVRITDYCDQNSVPTQERLDLFLKVCQAIQHAHQKGIIHRDIKPSNVLVTLHDGVPVPKVIDFGIAKATQGELTDKTIHTQFQQFIGTPAYMSPEQAEMSGMDVDTRSDIYSLGVLLYELLTGRTPFDAKDLMSQGIDAMRRTIREMEPAKPSTKVATMAGEELTTAAKRRSVDTAKLLHQLRGDLDWIVMKCLEKDRTRRYETANGLAADLKRHLENEPVVARPPSAAYRLQKAFRRNKLAFGAVAAVVMALLFGLGLSLWQYAGKSRAEREQYRLREQAEVRAREAREAQFQAAQQRDLAQQRLYLSLVREASSIRKARQSGYRNHVLARLKDALALQPADADRSVLRNEAVACFGDWVGLDPVDIAVPGPVFADALTSDGMLGAIGERSGRVIIYETRSGRQVASFQTEGVPRSLGFDPKGIALFISVVQLPDLGNRPMQGHVEKWSLRGDGTWYRERSKPRLEIFRYEQANNGLLALVLGTNDTYLAVEDAETEGELARVPLESSMIWWPTATVRPDRRQLTLVSRDIRSRFDVQLEVWNLETNARVAHIRPRLGPVWGLSYGWTGKALAVTYENTLLVYDTDQFGTSINMGGAFENTYGAIGGAFDQLLAIPATQELGVRIIERGSGGEVAYLKLPGVPLGSRFGAEGSVSVLTHVGGARIVRLRVEQEKILLQGHVGGVSAVEFSPDGKELASVGKDRTLRIWTLASGTSRVLGHLPASGQTLCYTLNGEHLVTGCYNTSEIFVWSVASGKQVARFGDDASPFNTTWSSAISANGPLLAAAGAGIRVWDLSGLLAPSNKAEWISRPLVTATNGVTGVFFDAKAESVYYQDDAGVPTGQPARVFRMNLQPGSSPILVATNIHRNYVQAQCALPKRGEIAYITHTREITILDMGTGRIRRTLPTRAPGDNANWFVTNLRASPDESKFALVTLSGLGVEIRDVTDGKLIYTLPEEPAAIWWLAWQPDSQRLAISRANGQIAIWNLAEINGQLAKLGLTE